MHFLELRLEIFSWELTVRVLETSVLFLEQSRYKTGYAAGERWRWRPEDQDSGGREKGSGRVPVVSWDPAGRG